MPAGSGQPWSIDLRLLSQRWLSNWGAADLFREFRALDTAA